MKRGQGRVEYLIIIVLIVLVGVALTGFLSSNFWAKKLGGKITVKLPPNAQFLNATWKDSDLWYLYRTASGAVIMQEQSPYGLLRPGFGIKRGIDGNDECTVCHERIVRPEDHVCRGPVGDRYYRCGCGHYHRPSERCWPF